MKIAKKRVSGPIGRLILTLLAVSLCGTAPGIGQQAGIEAQQGGTSAALPNAPKPTNGEAAPLPEIALAPGAQQSNRPGASPTESAEQGQGPHKPVGTAAAPPEGAAGIMASRPAGAVIAPAKQRRSRAILIRMGLLVGAGVALGTVLALTRATPSQPPH